ncbi:unnamed protein product [Paramecium sonneborni]|uniref:Uncharacterized protein n=1 Tax=Paramecium sonneborni TaxID=65129 RepID=A0A8S1P4G6_9CILI|nr:unnamed protein product [Paramecium sonneborni]
MESNSDYTEIKGFRVQESENELKLELRKRVENVEILICIDCLIKKKILIMRNKKKSLFESNNFNIYLTKGNGIMSCYECLAYRSNIQINMIQIIDNLKNLNQFQDKKEWLSHIQGIILLIQQQISYKMRFQIIQTVLEQTMNLDHL